MFNAFHKIRVLHNIDRSLLTESSGLFNFFYGFLKRINYVKTINRGGVQYKVPLIDGVGFQNLLPNYEQWFHNVIAAVLEEAQGTFIDVGANTGQTLLKVVPKYPQLKYVAIEPNKKCTTYLKELCSINNFHRVEIAETALASSIGEAALWTRYPDDILATTTSDFRKFTKYSNRTMVPTTTGTQLVQDLGLSELRLIKIDVEGGEVEVVAGFYAAIEKWRPYIICEILPLQSKAAEVATFRKKSAQRLLSLIHSLDYKVWNIHNRSVVASVEQLSSKLDAANYLFIPNEHFEQLTSKL